MIIRCTYAVFISCIFNVLCAQVVINEVSARNDYVIKDEEDDFEDWIELYNKGNYEINLDGYFLSDDINKPDKWEIPPKTLLPKEHLLIWASGKNRKKPIDTGASIAHAEEKWEYKVTTEHLSDEWKKIYYDGSGWVSTLSGEGKQDGDGDEVFTPPNHYVYLRKKFVVFNNLLIDSVVLSIITPYEFKLWINSIEIEPEQVEHSSSSQTKNRSNKSRDNYSIQRELKFNIGEQWEPGTNVLTALLQTGASFETVNIPSITVSTPDKHPEDQEWTKLYATKFRVHTNFKISNSGETIVLSNNDRALVDSFSVPYTQLNHSIGRFPDGGEDLLYFSSPSPEKSNISKTPFSGYVNCLPTFSKESGFYEISQQLELNSDCQACIIKYTLDGTEPNAGSRTFNEPIQIDTTIAVRARCFIDSLLPGEIVSNSYFIGERSTLPIVSLISDPENLWSQQRGIYASSGTIDLVEQEDIEANYLNDWEVPAHIEYFNATGEIEFEQSFGAKIHGAASRKYPQKSFRILAKSKYGKSKLDYRLFPEKEIDSYKRFLLRNSGNEWEETHFKDAFGTSLVKDETHNDVQAFVPVNLYINGAYWGVYNMREKIGKYFVESNHGVDADDIDLMEKNRVMLGSRMHFDRTAYFIMNNDLQEKDNFDQVQSMLDIENLADYFIVESFYDNTDWPQNNLKLWRDRENDSPWRYLLFDLDFSMGHKSDWVKYDACLRILTSESTHSRLFNKITENPWYRDYFVNRYLDLMNTLFSIDNVHSKIEEIRNMLIPEIPKHFERWGGSLEEWNGHIQELKDFFVGRSQKVRSYLQDGFDVGQEAHLLLDVSTNGAGSVELNSLELDKLPWSGIYFDKIPITLTIKENPGFQFLHWQVNDQTLESETITINVTDSTKVTAHFK